MKTKKFILNPMTKAIALLALSSGAITAGANTIENKTKTTRSVYEAKEGKVSSRKSKDSGDEIVKELRNAALSYLPPPNYLRNCNLRSLPSCSVML